MLTPVAVGLPKGLLKHGRLRILRKVDSAR